MAFYASYILSAGLYAGQKVGRDAWHGAFYDKGVLRAQLPPPKLDGIEAILVDEKYPGPSYGFVTLVFNARTGEPLHIAKGKEGGELCPWNCRQV